jgi:hypothetical protein
MTGNAVLLGLGIAGSGGRHPEHLGAALRVEVALIAVAAMGCLGLAELAARTRPE